MSMDNDEEIELRSFPGAYSGKAGQSWECRIKERIAVMPEREGYKPKVVLEPRPTPTITATAAQVSASDRATYGSTYIGVADSKGKVTPRRCPASNRPSARPRVVLAPPRIIARRPAARPSRHRSLFQGQAD